MRSRLFFLFSCGVLAGSLLTTAVFSSRRGQLWFVEPKQEAWTGTWDVKKVARKDSGFVFAVDGTVCRVMNDLDYACAERGELFAGTWR